MSETRTKEGAKVILGPLANDLPFMIRNLNAKLRPLGATVRDPLGIQSGSIGILSLIWMNPGISQNDLAANLAMKKSAVAKLVKQLETDGLLTRNRVSGDRRMNSIILTAQGHELMGRIRSLTVILNENITKEIPREELAVFFRVLEKLHDSLAERELKDLSANLTVPD